MAYGVQRASEFIERDLEPFGVRVAHRENQVIDGALQAFERTAEAAHDLIGLALGKLRIITSFAQLLSARDVFLALALRDGGLPDGQIEFTMRRLPTAD